MMCRGALPSSAAPSLTSLYIKASGLRPATGEQATQDKLPSFLTFDRQALTLAMGNMAMSAHPEAVRDMMDLIPHWQAL